MPPMPPQGAKFQPTFKLKDTKEVLCPCGGALFQEAFFLRLLSRVLTGEPRDKFITVPVLVCQKCKEPIQEMLPDELKTPKIV